MFAKLSRNNLELVCEAICDGDFEADERAFLMALLLLDKATALRLMHELTWIICGLEDPFDRDVSNAELV